jgi:hypothetical protein
VNCIDTSNAERLEDLRAIMMQEIEEDRGRKASEVFEEDGKDE